MFTNLVESLLPMKFKLVLQDLVEKAFGLLKDKVLKTVFERVDCTNKFDLVKSEATAKVVKSGPETVRKWCGKNGRNS